MTHSVAADVAKATLAGGKDSAMLWEAQSPTEVAPQHRAAPAGAAVLDALQLGRSSAPIEIAAARPPAGRSPPVLVGVSACPRPSGEIVPPTTPAITIPLRLDVTPMAVDGGSAATLATRCALALHLRA